MPPEHRNNELLIRSAFEVLEQRRDREKYSTREKEYLSYVINEILDEAERFKVDKVEALGANAVPGWPTLTSEEISRIRSKISSERQSSPLQLDPEDMEDFGVGLEDQMIEMALTGAYIAPEPPKDPPTFVRSYDEYDYRAAAGAPRPEFDCCGGNGMTPPEHCQDCPDYPLGGLTRAVATTPMADVIRDFVSAIDRNADELELSSMSSDLMSSIVSAMGVPQSFLGGGQQREVQEPSMGFTVLPTPMELPATPWLDEQLQRAEGVNIGVDMASGPEITTMGGTGNNFHNLPGSVGPIFVTDPSSPVQIPNQTWPNSIPIVISPNDGPILRGPRYEIPTQTVDRITLTFPKIEEAEEEVPEKVDRTPRRVIEV